MLRARSRSNICEQEARFVQERITSVEKYFAELCAIFAAFTRKSARLRDKSDEVAKVIRAYVQAEGINQSLSSGLANFAATLSIIGDYRDAQVRRLDAKVVSPLSQYSVICKHAREDVRNAFAARDKELTRRRHLDKSQAESDLMKATVEVSRVVKGLEEQIDSFERRKLRDLKTALVDFVTIELSFHAKAVELLTKAHRDVSEIDEARDSQEFREAMRVPDSASRLDTVRRTSLRQAYSLASNPTSRFTSSSPIVTAQRSNDGTAESPPESSKTGLTDSSESVRVEEYGESSDESDRSETIQEKPMKATEHAKRRVAGRLCLKAIPPIPTYQKSLTSSMIHGMSYSQLCIVEENEKRYVTS